MRIITWNVNALRTVLPYRPWNDLEDKSIRGMLNAMDAEVICFQEHKARRDQMQKAMAVPDGYDAFFSFPVGKGGYSGTCTYVKTDYAVPLKAEEGITGILLNAPTSIGGVKTGGSGTGTTGSKLVYRDEDKIGGYPDEDDLVLEDEVNGESFDLKKLDVEGRAVVLDFGFFVIFNLYCPNETNDARLPYKLNYLRYLQARVNRLVAQGRNVIIVGDINVCHRPIDNGEGGIQRNAEEHFNHPARRWFDDWIAPKGMMHDVTRERWPDRRGMFTCWNTKLDARPSNYGARIDYVLVTEGLLPWIKDSDIQADIMGSDHCPVHVELHEEITQPDGSTLRLKDLMNNGRRIPLPSFLQTLIDPSRTAPEPPPFATKFWDEFSGKQRSLKDFFGRPAQKTVPRTDLKSDEQPTSLSKPSLTKDNDAAMTETNPKPEVLHSDAKKDVVLEISDDEEDIDPATTGTSAIASAFGALEDARRDSSTGRKDHTGLYSQRGQKRKRGPSSSNIASYFKPPARSPTEEPSTPDGEPPSSASSRRSVPMSVDASIQGQDLEKDELIARALAEEDGDSDEGSRSGNTTQAVSAWSSIFAKKVPPRCIVHDMPCKSFSQFQFLCSSRSGPLLMVHLSRAAVKIPGPNKGKKFWLCSNFLWDSAVKAKERTISDAVDHNSQQKRPI